MYTVRKIKTFRGHEGEGFNAELCRDGKKICDVIDEGNGGEIYFEGLSGADRTQLETFIKDKTWEFDGHVYEMSPDVFVGELVGDELERRRIARLCKKHLVARVREGAGVAVYQYKGAYTAELAAHVRKEHGDKLIEIVNETPELFRRG